MEQWRDEAIRALGRFELTRELGGGDVSRALRCERADGAGPFFLKVNEHAPAELFALEARGLEWLRVDGGPQVPQVLAVGRRFLALEWIDPGPSGPAAQRALGAALATLHRSGAPAFGLGYDNTLATLAQRNGEHASWPAFWVEHRIAPLVDLALARGRGEASWPAAVERLRRRAAQLWPDEPPARLHGDLWSGNVLFAARGPTILDPAVYGGHREIDLAMLALFGGLREDTVAAYQATYPLCPGWRARQPLAQLYPLLAHAVLFGGGYRAQADALLRRL